MCLRHVFFSSFAFSRPFVWLSSLSSFFLSFLFFPIFFPGLFCDFYHVAAKTGTRWHQELSTNAIFFIYYRKIKEVATITVFFFKTPEMCITSAAGRNPSKKKKEKRPHQNAVVSKLTAKLDSEDSSFISAEE